METKAIVFGKPMDKRGSRPPPLRNEMRPARGLLVGLALSSILWLVITVIWLAV